MRGMEVWKRNPVTTSDHFLSVSLYIGLGSYDSSLKGKTFENVIINLAAKTILVDQFYVALFRRTTYNGLVLRRPINSSQVILDERGIDFPLESLQINQKWMTISQTIVFEGPITSLIRLNGIANLTSLISGKSEFVGLLSYAVPINDTSPSLTREAAF